MKVAMTAIRSRNLPRPSQRFLDRERHGPQLTGSGRYRYQMDAPPQERWQGVDDLFQGGDVIIDLGCGDGGWLDAIAPRYRRAIGIDIIGPQIGHQTAGANGWEFIQADLDLGLPLDDEIADVIRANQVIEHVREPGEFLAGARRVLRPGGLLVVTTPNVRYVRHLARLVFLGHGPMTSSHPPGAASAWDDGHLHYLTPGDLRRIAHQAGFGQVRVSALIAPSGRFRLLRGVLRRLSGVAPIREFFSGNMILVARR
jgi:SAM-dependent methyltransferase